MGTEISWAGSSACSLQPAALVELSLQVAGHGHCPPRRVLLELERDEAAGMVRQLEGILAAIRADGDEPR